MIVGGGQAAFLKARDLLKAHADIFVVSPSLSPSLRRLAERGKLIVWHRVFRATDVMGMFMVFATTDDPKVQEKIYRICQEKGVLVNIVDKPALSDFYAVATLRAGDILVAISTSGGSPRLAAFLKKRWLADIKAAALYLKFLKKYRSTIQKRVSSRSKRRDRLRRLVDEETFSLFLKGDLEQAQRKLEKAISEEDEL